MRILFLPNWPVHFTDEDIERYQAPDKYVKGQSYWFFKFFPEDTFVDVIDIKTNNVISFFEKKLKFYIIQALRAYRRQDDYDVILSHGAQSGVVLSLLRRLFGKGKAKHVIFDIGGMNGARTAGMSTWLIQLAMKSNPAIICHSTNILDNLATTYPWLLYKATFIHFGVGLYQYKLKDLQEYEKEIFVFSGTKRDENTVREAWQQIVGNGEHDGYVLNFIGTLNHHEVPYTKDIRRLKYDDYIDKLGKSAFVILPLNEYKYSYGQMSLLGALALGKKIIATNVSGISDYLALCDGVITVEEKNVGKMRKAILSCINNPSEPEDRMYFRNQVETHFNECDMALKIHRFLSSL